MRSRNIILTYYHKFYGWCPPNKDLTINVQKIPIESQFHKSTVHLKYSYHVSQPHPKIIFESNLFPLKSKSPASPEIPVDLFHTVTPVSCFINVLHANANETM